MNDKILKNIIKIASCGVLYYSGIFFILNRMLKRKGLLIFSYHNFNTFTNSYWRSGSIYITDFTNRFAKQIRFLKKNVGFIKSSQIEETYFDSSLKALITFDDGYLDNYQNAYPLLRDHSVPAVFFIATSYMGNHGLIWHDKIRLLAETGIESKKNIKRILSMINRGQLKPSMVRGIQEIEIDRGKRLMMNWQEVAEIASAGFYIGAHSRTHEPLAALDKRREESEIRNSIADIMKRVHQEKVYFSPPNGSYSENTDAILRDAGVDYAFSTDPGINETGQGRFRLKRVALNPGDPVCVVAMKVLISKIVG